MVRDYVPNVEFVFVTVDAASTATPSCSGRARTGWFVYLEKEGVTFRVCRAGEDENGNICRTLEEHELHVDFGEAFRVLWMCRWNPCEVTSKECAVAGAM